VLFILVIHSKISSGLVFFGLSYGCFSSTQVM